MDKNKKNYFNGLSYINIVARMNLLMHDKFIAYYKKNKNITTCRTIFDRFFLLNNLLIESILDFRIER